MARERLSPCGATVRFPYKWTSFLIEETERVLAHLLVHEGRAAHVVTERPGRSAVDAVVRGVRGLWPASHREVAGPERAD